MKPTEILQESGQSLWLDNITRELLESGTLQRYIDQYSVTGLTSNPTIFDHALRDSASYDSDIAGARTAAAQAEELFFELALSDVRRAADLFRPVFDRTDKVDGWVSLEVSPLLARDAKVTLDAARHLHQRAGRSNLLIKIPGTTQGLAAIEEAIFAGIPVNVTLLFSRQQYVACAQAWLRGIERRIKAGCDPAVGSVASVFVSRWDVAANARAPHGMANRLGIAMAQQVYGAYREMLASERFQRAANRGARPQRLLWASTGTKDPHAGDTLYIEALAAPLTINTMPEKTLVAFADHGRPSSRLVPDSGDSEQVLAAFSGNGVDPQALATRLQDEGAASFVSSWNDLLARICKKRSAAVFDGQKINTSE